MNNSKKPALGKGLSALLENSNTDITSGDTNDNATVGSITSIPVRFIETNPFQPRTKFEKEAIMLSKLIPWGENFIKINAELL